MEDGIKINAWDDHSKERFKAIEEIDAGIEAILKTEDLDTISCEDLKARFFKLFELFPLSIVFLKKELCKDFKVYRVRKFDEVRPSEIFSSSSFSNPPWNKDIGPGRANWRGRNVFYGSDTVNTALKEIKETSVGNDFYISKWGIDPDKLNVDKIQMASLLYKNISEKNKWNVISDNNSKKIEEVSAQIGREASEKFNYLIKRINNLFVLKDRSKYPITAFIADYIIYFNRNTLQEIYFPILIYPSVESESVNCNFAIHPFFVKQCMRLEKVIHVKLDEVNPNYFKIEFKKIGATSKDTCIEWYTLAFDETKSGYQIKSLGCNSCGKKIDLNEIDKIVFTKNKGETTHGEIIANFLRERNYSDFCNVDDIIEADGIMRGVEVAFTNLPLKDVTATINGEVHGNLTMDINVIQPYEYKKWPS